MDTYIFMHIAHVVCTCRTKHQKKYLQGKNQSDKRPETLKKLNLNKGNKQRKRQRN